MRFSVTTKKPKTQFLVSSLGLCWRVYGSYLDYPVKISTPPHKFFKPMYTVTASWPDCCRTKTRRLSLISIRQYSVTGYATHPGLIPPTAFQRLTDLYKNPDQMCIISTLHCALRQKGRAAVDTLPWYSYLHNKPSLGLFMKQNRYFSS